MGTGTLPVGLIVAMSPNKADFALDMRAKYVSIIGLTRYESINLLEDMI